MAKSTGKKRKRAESLLTEKADVVPESKPALDNELKKKKKKKKKKKADCPEIKMDISPAGNKNQESETVTPLESLKSGEYNNRTNREIFKGQLNKTGIFYVKGKLFDGLLEKLSRAIESTKQLEGHVHDNIWKKAVLAASDCHPRVLVSHLLGLASSRGIPLIFVEDHGKSSLRLGQLLKLRKAAAIGIKGRTRSGIYPRPIHELLPTNGAPTH